jgi:hypothetical protein
MIVLNDIACGDDYTPAATIAFVYESSGGYGAVRSNDAFVSLAWSDAGGAGADQGSEQWTPEFRMSPGNLALSPHIIGIRFRNAVPGQVATITAVLSSKFEPPVFLTAAGVAGSGGGSALDVTDGVVTINPTNVLLIGSGLALTNPLSGVAAVAVSPTVTNRKILACWAGPLPVVIPQVSVVWRVPYNPDGTTYTFSLTRAFARIESTQASTIQIVVQKSPGGGIFTPSTVTTLAITGGNYDTENTGIAFSVTSGDLLRLSFSAVPGSLPQPNFQVEVEGSQ